MVPSISPLVRLNTGQRMPQLGLGVFQSEPGPVTGQAVRAALEVGYRLFDTARMYRNESDVGEALRSSGLPREELFVTTKLLPRDHGRARTQAAYRASQEALGLGPVDLYLIHWPGGGARRETWEAMEGVVRDGSCRAIGVSNFTVRHLEELLSHAQVLPAVNQVEFHPFLFQRELLEYCRRQKILLEAYTPLADAAHFDDPSIREVAARHQRTPAQVMLRWGVQHEVVVIPKSTRRARIEENSRIFDFSLSPVEMQTLDGLDRGLRTRWDPTGVP